MRLRDVRFHIRRFVEPILPDIANYAHDSGPWLCIIPSAQLDLLADGILIREHLARAVLADHRYLRRVWAVLIREHPPALERNLHDAEIVRRDGIRVRTRIFRRIGGTLPNMKSIAVEAEQRKIASHRNAFDAGGSTETIHGLLIVSQLDLGFLIARVHKRRYRG